MDEKLLIANVPFDCKDEFLKSWIEARGYRIFRLTMVRDLVSGTSPAFARVQLMDDTKLGEAVRSLHGRNLLGRTVDVKALTAVTD